MDEDRCCGFMFCYILLLLFLLNIDLSVLVISRKFDYSSFLLFGIFCFVGLNLINEWYVINGWFFYSILLIVIYFLDFVDKGWYMYKEKMMDWLNIIVN